jgi:hypothetical protein
MYMIGRWSLNAYAAKVYATAVGMLLMSELGGGNHAKSHATLQAGPIRNGR